MRIYTAAVRAGKGKEVEEILLKEKAGKATAKQSQKVREIYHEQRDQERLAYIQRATKTRDVESEHGYLRAVVKRGKGEPRYMSEERFARFMGRERKRRSAEEERSRYAAEVSGAARRDPTIEEQTWTSQQQEVRAT